MNLRQLLATDRPLVGHFVFEFATPGIGYLLRNAGADFMVLDLEHSGFGLETAKLVVLGARAAGLPLIVRIPTANPSDVSRACDIGADGVMAPMVESAQQARAIVAAAKYPPQGRRGVGQLQMHDRYRVGPFPDKAAAANAALAVLVQIESVAGVAAADDIAAVEGVDALWLGHMDLSCSLGEPARFDAPAFVDAAAAIAAAARRHAKRAGRLVAAATDAPSARAAGFDCLAVGGDTLLYQSALTQAIGAARR